MKGLTGVLGSFSEGLRVRKILPSLLEEVRPTTVVSYRVLMFLRKMKDTQLLPNILPNVFAISHVLTATQFASLVLPSLKPLFIVKDPPQNMMTLLENLKILQEKTEKNVFLERESLDACSHPLGLAECRCNAVGVQCPGFRAHGGRFCLKVEFLCSQNARCKNAL
jgi:hypothetical protein